MRLVLLLWVRIILKTLFQTNKKGTSLPTETFVGQQQHFPAWCGQERSGGRKTVLANWMLPNCWLSISKMYHRSPHSRCKTLRSITALTDRGMCAECLHTDLTPYQNNVISKAKTQNTNENKTKINAKIWLDMKSLTRSVVSTAWRVCLGISAQLAAADSFSWHVNT